MRREDFKEIKEEYIMGCKKIIKQEGDCVDVGCDNCPFSCENLSDTKLSYCGKYIHPNVPSYYSEVDNLRLEKALQFIQQFEKEVNKPFLQYNNRIDTYEMSEEEMKYKEYLKSLSKEDLIDKICKLKEEVKYYQKERDRERERADYYRVEGQGRGKFG